VILDMPEPNSFEDVPRIIFPKLVRGIAASMLAGQWNASELLRRLIDSFGSEQIWMDGLVKRVIRKFGNAQPPSSRLLIEFLRKDRTLDKIAFKHRPTIIKNHLTPTAMAKGHRAPSTWPVPILTTDDDLCKWLNVSHEHLAWFSGVFSPESKRTKEPLRHYSYKWVEKRSGGWRLLEIPKSKLKEIQRHILSDLLDKIPPHINAHGFKKGGSTKSFVIPHTGHALALRMDLKDFFNSIQASRVHTIFRTVGYSEHIARMFTSLCTNTVSAELLHVDPRARALSPGQRMHLRTPHLPQGAPTSPALANLCARRFDARVTALALKFGWAYTRYADDLLFSGSRFRSEFLAQFIEWIELIAKDEHLAVNVQKTRVMHSNARQQAAGLVLNDTPNIPRDEFDVLKATLFNCVKHGPATQNHDGIQRFREHLLGRIGHVSHVNLVRGMKLKKLFEKITWPA